MSLITIGHEVVIDLSIPKASLRGYQISSDTFLVDRRRLKRIIRRARDRDVPAWFKTSWLDRLKRLERLL
jgi:hypothetical protein